MIFSHTLHQVINGFKQQTRRVVKSDEFFDSELSAILKVSGRMMYQVGRSYAIQPGRGKKAVGRILVTDIRREKVSLISEADVYCEGFQSKADFLKAWRSIHGPGADSDGDVWVIEFRLHSLCTLPMGISDENDTQKSSADYSKDLSCAIQEIPGNRLYSGDQRTGRVGEVVPHRLSLPASKRAV